MYSSFRHIIQFTPYKTNIETSTLIYYQDESPVSIQQRKPVLCVKQVYHNPHFYFHFILGNVHVILCNIYAWLVDGSNYRKDLCQRCNCEYL